MPDPIYAPTAPVLVTGATGYVAGWLVKRLLQEGFTVHAPVRDLDNQQKVAHLIALAADAPGQIIFFKADLLDAGSYAEAMAGCEVVFHTASPFTSKFGDPQRDLVDPALIGTRNVLTTATETPSVTRVVVTSSCAAIYGDNVDVAKAPNQTLTEAQWNETSSLDHQPYFYSKTVAERAAWGIADAQDQWRLVTVNPSLVIGPGVAAAHSSESFSVIKQFADGTMKPGAPPLEVGMVDVRDVAEAHMRAGFLPDAKGRHITSAVTMSFAQLGRALSAKMGPDWPFPKSELPKLLVWLVGPLASRTITRAFVEKNMGHPWRADSSKARDALGVTFHDVVDAAAEMVQQMADNGQIRNRQFPA